MVTGQHPVKAIHDPPTGADDLAEPTFAAATILFHQRHLRPSELGHPNCRAISIT